MRHTMGSYTDRPEISLSGLRQWKKAGGKLCIYCAGLHGTEWFEILDHFGIQVDLFLDNATEKWGREPAGGVVCVSPLEIAGRDDCLTFVCAGADIYQSVWETALRQGIRHLTEVNELVDHLISHDVDKYLELIRFHAQQPQAGIFIYRPMGGEQYPHANRLSLAEHERIAVYTGIFGDYDSYCAPSCYPDKVDYYLISDETPPKLPRQVSWIDGRSVIPQELHSPILRNRYIKMHAHELFGSYRYSAYVDGNIMISGGMTDYLLKSTAGVSAFMHPNVDCVFYEALCITNDGRVDVDDVCTQMQRYRKEGMKIHFGMPEMCLVVRDHENALGTKIMETWWEEFCAGALRDQFSFAYALWKNGASIDDMAFLGRSIHTCADFTQYPHRHKSMHIKNKGSTKRTERNDIPFP